MEVRPFFKKVCVVLQLGRLLGCPRLNRGGFSWELRKAYCEGLEHCLVGRPSSVCVHSDSPEQMLCCTVTYKPLVMEGLTCPGVTEQTPLLVGRLLKALKAAAWTELALQRPAASVPQLGSLGSAHGCRSQGRCGGVF